MAARRYLEDFGVQIARNGYEVIPIVPGEKRPYGKRWQTYDGTEEGVLDWIKSDKGGYGVGIKTKHTPAVDIDVLDAKVVAEIEEMVSNILGKGMARVGLPPKTMLVYQTDEPFPKVDTGFWVDDKGRKVKVEILGDGQQFVAAHIHPDTGKPYQWLNGHSVLKTPRDDLPIIRQSHADAIREASIQIFVKHGWTKYTNAVKRLDASGYDPDDPFAAVRARTDISDDKLFTQLMKVPGNEDYETWFFCGMSLFHQYDGGQQGLDLWHQWSSTAPNYDAKALDDKWPTFEIAGKDRPPLTARWILARANDVDQKINTELLSKAREAVSEATDLPTLKKACEDYVKTVQFDPLVREMLTSLVKERFKTLVGSLPRISIIRDLTRYESTENHVMPGWLKNWVYLGLLNNFFNTSDRRELTSAAFDNTYSRLMLSAEDRLQGKATPETPPTQAALNLYQIPEVHNKMYMPGEDPLYMLNGVKYCNSFTDIDVPIPPEEYSPAEREAIATVEEHLQLMIRDPEDREMVLDFMTFIVQQPRRRINWAILLQGAEGGGKSFFYTLLTVVLGMSNTIAIPGKVLEEKYNPWAEGARLCFIEDVRLHGNNRYDAVNTLKPMLTNMSVTIRRMNTDVYTVINTMNYILTANAKDALPVGDQDTRFFPVFTRFQSNEAMAAFNRANPDYFNNLHGALNFGGALRKWFLEREISPSFNANARAPRSSNRAEMVEMNRSDEDRALIDALEDDKPDFCSILLDSAKVHEAFMDSGALVPQTKALNRLLAEHGFSFLGRYRINNERRRFWSQRPEIWSMDEDERGDQIRDYLDPEGL